MRQQNPLLPEVPLSGTFPCFAHSDAMIKGERGEAWLEEALTSSKDGIQNAAKWQIAQRLLDGGLEEVVRPGSPHADLVGQWQPNYCMEPAMED
eukprot:jgi/Tetstr1/458145/TSEL_044637.t1